jgi:uncharacterized Zn-binding protein involved in type VI secretion
MSKIARQGDRGSGCGGSGSITGASTHFSCRGARAAKDGDSYSCSKHGQQSVKGNHHWKINGKSIILEGDKTTCGATIQSGAGGTDVNN